eukprot:c24637_g5_i1 orf=162-2540(+)
MPLQMLSRHAPCLRRAVASPAPVLRTCRSSSLSFLHGNHILSLDSSLCSTNLPAVKGVLNTPLTWISAASYKQQAEIAPPSAKPKPRQNANPDNVWRRAKDEPGNVAMVPAKRSSNSSKARDGSPFIASKSAQAFTHPFRSSSQSNWTTSKLSRALHSAVGDDDESDDLDDFLIGSEAPKSKVRNSNSAAAKRSRSPPSKVYKSEEDDEVPIITTKRRRASAIDACEDSEEDEGVLSSSRMRSVPASRVKPQRSDNGSTVAASRAMPMKKRPIALESAESNEGERSSESDSDEEIPVDEESKPASGGNSLLEDTDSSLSHLSKTRFDSFPISSLSIKALHSVLKYERMTEVQEATFPIILKGQDLLAKARTGTGKTIAFLLPAIEAILKAPEGRSRNPIHVVIVCPTRELAQQAAAEAQTLLQFHRGLGAQVVYGGNSIRGEQMNLSRKPCQILVGTPGRLVDHIQRTTELGQQLKSVKLFVLDEADHMLDMGFRDSLQKIMQALPSKRQTLLFSATIPKEVHNMAKIALRSDHIFVDAVGKGSEDTHAKVKQQYIMVPLEKQIRVLYAALKQHMEADPQYKVLVFCTTARTTGFMCKLFMNLGFNSREIHSRKDQSYRTRVSDEFRKSKGGIILFTSDVSARGVDYPNVTLVVQLGAPSEFEQYIHRLGRTGRAGKKGEGLLILAPWEDYFLQKLAKLPITPLPAPKLSAQAKEKILSASCQVDSSVKEMAYTAWLGYYRSLKGASLDKVTLVEYANQFSSSMGFDEPPALSRMVASKMALSGVPGLRLKR